MLDNVVTLGIAFALLISIRERSLKLPSLLPPVLGHSCAWVLPGSTLPLSVDSYSRKEQNYPASQTLSQSLWGTKTTHGGGLSDPSSISLRLAQDSTRDGECFCLHFESLSTCRIWHTVPVPVLFNIRGLCGWRFSLPLRDQQGTSTA